MERRRDLPAATACPGCPAGGPVVPSSRAQGIDHQILSYVICVIYKNNDGIFHQIRKSRMVQWLGFATLTRAARVRFPVWETFFFLF